MPVLFCLAMVVSPQFYPFKSRFFVLRNMTAGTGPSGQHFLCYSLIQHTGKVSHFSFFSLSHSWSHLYMCINPSDIQQSLLRLLATSCVCIKLTFWGPSLSPSSGIWYLVSSKAPDHISVTLYVISFGDWNRGSIQCSQFVFLSCCVLGGGHIFPLKLLCFSTVFTKAVPD